MNWMKKIGGSQSDEEENPIIYLTPEALKHVYVMPAEEFDTFQNSKEFVPGGRLMEVSRQYSYTVRKVADLREETVTYCNRPKGAAGAGESAPMIDNQPADAMDLAMG